MTVEPQAQPLNVVLIGPPGAGKSTIAEELIHQRPSFVMISTGQLLRSEIKGRTRLGRSVEGLLEQGDLAPDSVMDRVLRGSLESLDARQGILLDGYPRTMRQALGLSMMLADFGRSLDAVLALEVGDDEVVRRLSGRRICEGAGEPFPIHVDDLASMLRCRERGGSPVQRDDDRPEVVQQRLRVYHQQTAPLLDFYFTEGYLHRVDAADAPAEVARRALAVLAAVPGSTS
jgi:adenylate kinase